MVCRRAQKRPSSTTTKQWDCSRSSSTWQNLPKLSINHLFTNISKTPWCAMSPTGRSRTRLSTISSSQPPSKSGRRHPKSNHTPTKQGRNAQNPRNFSSKSHLLSCRSDDDKVPGLVHSFSPILSAYLSIFPLSAKNEHFFQRVQAIFLPISPTAGYRDHETRPGVIPLVD